MLFRSVDITLPNSHYVAWYDSGTSGGTAAYVQGVGGVLHLAGSSISTDANVAVSFGTGSLTCGAITSSNNQDFCLIFHPQSTGMSGSGRGQVIFTSP